MNVRAIGHLQTLFEVGTVAGMPDRVLLERFIARRDDLAFEAIVARHGPMVLGLCRRMLSDLSDAEDAFQATFLILVRRAGSLRDRERLGPWLYGVAQRVSARARAQAARRRLRERPGAALAAVSYRGDLERLELRAVLDDEVSRLPEKFKAPLVLCDIEGRTHEEAAGQLGCPLGTVKSRLTWARRRLRSRLVRRGLAPSAITFWAGVTAQSTTTAVPPALTGATVRCAQRFVEARAGAAGVISGSIWTLTEGVDTTMFLSKLMTVGAILLIVGTCAAGLGVLAQPPSAKKEDKQIEALELQRQSLVKQLEALEFQKRAFMERRERAAHFKELQDKTAVGLQNLGATVERDVVSVNLVATKVTDDDLSSLSVFPNLQTLHLHHTSIGDAGVANLKGLRNLTTLDLFDTRVTDAGLEHLAQWMPHLEWLELYDTRVTDAGLSSLKGLRHLRRLDVRKTKVTDAGVDELRRAVPGAEILH
jgi:RNA polymerase sigma factor (sigma-70 family)